MQVIGFFGGLFSTLANVVAFINTPLGELTGSKVIQSTPLADLSIISMFGFGLVATLGVFLALRLFQLVNPL